VGIASVGKSEYSGTKNGGPSNITQTTQKMTNRNEYQKHKKIMFLGNKGAAGA
jgi:hypothetical protein